MRNVTLRSTPRCQDKPKYAGPIFESLQNKIGEANANQFVLYAESPQISAGLNYYFQFLFLFFFLLRQMPEIIRFFISDKIAFLVIIV